MAITNYYPNRDDCLRHEVLEPIQARYPCEPVNEGFDIDAFAARVIKRTSVGPYGLWHCYPPDDDFWTILAEYEIPGGE